MKISLDEIKAAMEYHIKETTPPDGFYSAEWYRKNLYPELGHQRVSAILASMVARGEAMKSDAEYLTGRKTRLAWHYKIIV